MTLKRLNAPGFWPIARKTKKFVIDPSPGPYGKEKCIPLGILIRDVLKYSENLSETKQILNKGLVRVDGIVRKSYKFPIGLLDVINIGDEIFRVFPRKRGFHLQKIEKDESKIKPLKVLNKKSLKKDRIQLNLHDGKNILVDKNVYKTGDVVLFDLEQKKIIDTLMYKRGATVLITGGNRIGDIGIIEDIMSTRGFEGGKVVVKIGQGLIETKRDYVFVI